MSSLAIVGWHILVLFVAAMICWILILLTNPCRRNPGFSEEVAEANYFRPRHAPKPSPGNAYPSMLATTNWDHHTLGWPGRTSPLPEFSPTHRLSVQQNSVSILP